MVGASPLERMATSEARASALRRQGATCIGLGGAKVQQSHASVGDPDDSTSRAPAVGDVLDTLVQQMAETPRTDAFAGSATGSGSGDDGCASIAGVPRSFKAVPTQPGFLGESCREPRSGGSKGSEKSSCTGIGGRRRGDGKPGGPIPTRATPELELRLYASLQHDPAAGLPRQGRPLIPNDFETRSSRPKRPDSSEVRQRGDAKSTLQRNVRPGFELPRIC